MRVEKIHSHRYPSPICYLHAIHWIASCLVGSLEIQELQVEWETYFLEFVCFSDLITAFELQNHIRFFFYKRNTNINNLLSKTKLHPNLLLKMNDSINSFQQEKSSESTRNTWLSVHSNTPQKFIVVAQKICGCYVNSRTKLHLRTSVSYLLSCSYETGHPLMFKSIFSLAVRLLFFFIIIILDHFNILYWK
jgi:hypothetical protein